MPSNPTPPGKFSGSGASVDSRDHRQIYRVTLVGLVFNLLLAGFKFLGGIYGHSSALVADAVHSLTDTATDVAVLLGAHIWRKPPDANHPHGHRRFETLITALIGISLGLVAIGLLGKAVKALYLQSSSTPGWLALIAALVSIVVKELLYWYTVVVGRRVNSRAVIANAWHHRSDAFSSLPVLLAVGAMILMPRLWWMDNIGALLVSVFIFIAAYNIVRPAIAELLDIGAPLATQRQLHEIAAAVDGVRDIHELRTRYLCGGLQVDLHMMVDAQLSVAAAHEISRQVRLRLLDEGPDVMDVLVHVEPFEVGLED
jgi:cation diffusion facilitator family transporter